ncbi:hypothetical protein D3C86_945130 [compost metagenome]
MVGSGQAVALRVHEDLLVERVHLVQRGGGVQRGQQVGSRGDGLGECLLVGLYVSDGLRLLRLALQRLLLQLRLVGRGADRVDFLTAVDGAIQ